MFQVQEHRVASQDIPEFDFLCSSLCHVDYVVYFWLELETLVYV